MVEKHKWVNNEPFFAAFLQEIECRRVCTYDLGNLKNLNTSKDTFSKFSETYYPVNTELFSNWKLLRQNLRRIFNACCFIIYDNFRNISEVVVQ